MGNARDFVLNIIGNDKASKVVDGVGDAVGRNSEKWDSFRTKANVALAATSAAVVAFATQSVKAYAESEVSQEMLNDAYARFPALADVSLQSLRDLNSELATKTKYDDDATASGQAVLAQFKLTGEQVTELTPLLQDYATKTGKDLPTAAEDLGKALLGQGRSLKAIGINFKDTGSAAGNFDQLVAGLRSQVGGFAEKEGKTATGQAAILQNQFGEVQETVGGALMPTLMSLTGVLISGVTWINNNTGAAAALAAGFGTLALAVGVAANWTTISTTAARVAAAATWLWNGANTALRLALSSTGATAVGVAVLTAAEWVKSSVSSAASMAATGAAAVAQGARTAAAWVAAGASATASFIATGATAVAQGAVSAGAWVASTARTAGAVVVQTGALVGSRAAMIAGAAATGIVTAAQWAWNAAMSANPIGIVIVAIGALVAAIVWCVANWDKVKAAGSAAWSGIRSAWEGAGRFFSGIGDGIKGAFKGAFNAVARWWNNGPGAIGFTVPDWVPLVGGRRFEIPNIPMLAAGGNITRSGLALVGEAGPELLRLPAGAQVQPLSGGGSPASWPDGGPVDLSDETIERLAAALLAGQQKAAISAIQVAATGRRR